jgi:hypothetical protein
LRPQCDELLSSFAFNFNLRHYNLADGERHNVRVEYDPVLHPEAATHPSFQASPHLTNLVRRCRSTPG